MDLGIVFASGAKQESHRLADAPFEAFDHGLHGACKVAGDGDPQLIGTNRQGEKQQVKDKEYRQQQSNPQRISRLPASLRYPQLRWHEKDWHTGMILRSRRVKNVSEKTSTRRPLSRNRIVRGFRNRPARHCSHCQRSNHHLQAAPCSGPFLKP